MEIVDRAPTSGEHARLRAIAGMSGVPAGATPAGLAASWFAVTARTPEGRVVGMGRLVGDGALFLQVVDVAVEPEHQGRGVGSRLLERLLQHVDRCAPDAYVSLVAEPPGQALYRRFGFVDVAPSLGMKRVR
ncbi:GNAT family N-acetyltransferase [Actinomycetospora sp. NBC_00405]|uniref:GNAT family N-acetyltransferase n=1 Tax=Actinomycetospora sp. NBC_00405 TaxID=2975952 RepID=UPI002E1ADC11